MRILKVSEINEIDKFLRLKEKWDRLIKRNEISNPFLCFEWFFCCLNHYYKDKNLVVLIVESGNRLIGIAPLWQYKKKLRSIHLRVIEFINSPDSAMCDFIIDHENREDALNSIYKFLLKRKKEQWDLFIVYNVNSKSANLPLQKSILEKNKIKYYNKIISKTPYVKVNKEWEKYFTNLSTKFRKSRRNITNRIKKLSNVKVECVKKGYNMNIMRDILKVSQKSWKAKEGLSICSKKTTQGFFECLTKIAHDNSWLFVWFLKVNDYPIAVEYDLACDKKVYALRADFNEGYKKYSPGAYLEYQIIKYLHENNYQEYNTGPGINKYKLNWTDNTKENISIYVCNKTFKAMALYSLEKKLIPLLKKFRPNRE